MNKITQRSLRDIHATLPEGTECYLCGAVRKALTMYRKGKEPGFYLEKDQALSQLSQKLGRGLRRFLRNDIQAAISANQGAKVNRMA